MPNLTLTLVLALTLYFYVSAIIIFAFSYWVDGPIKDENKKAFVVLMFLLSPFFAPCLIIKHTLYLPLRKDKDNEEY